METRSHPFPLVPIGRYKHISSPRSCSPEQQLECTSAAPWLPDQLDRSQQTNGLAYVLVLIRDPSTKRGFAAARARRAARAGRAAAGWRRSSQPSAPPLRRRLFPATTAIVPSRAQPNHNRARERPGSAQRRVKEAGRTSLLKPSSPPRSTRRSRRLARRRRLRLQAPAGCFL